MSFRIFMNPHYCTVMDHMPDLVGLIDTICPYKKAQKNSMKDSVYYTMNHLRIFINIFHKSVPLRISENDYSLNFISYLLIQSITFVLILNCVECFKPFDSLPPRLLDFIGTSSIKDNLNERIL